MQDLYFFIAISKRSDAEEFISLFQRLEVPRLYSTLAHGTARSQTLDLLGIEQSEKTIHQTVITHNKMHELIDALENELQIDLPDRGIALAIPLASIATKKALDFFSGDHAEDEMIENEQKTAEMELIVVICNKGHTDEVMSAAREAGAGGGTVIHAKGTGAAYADKFFGISIMDEKELIYIVSKKESRSAIMTAIIEHAGAGTKAHAVVFSVPVTDTAGFRLYRE